MARNQPRRAVRPLSEQSIDWLELFFDLVAVAAVAVITESLAEKHTAAALGILIVCYTGIWLTWVNVVLYIDVARTGTRLHTVAVVMFLLATMAAAAPVHYPA